MSETSNTLMVCKPCGATFERQNRMGRKPTFCPPCALEARRTSGRDWARRDAPSKKAQLPLQFTCADCLQECTRPARRGAMPTRCKPCAKARTHAIAMRSQTERRAEARAARSERPPCLDCGAGIPHPTQGPGRARCEDCQRRRENVLKMVRYRAARAANPPPAWKIASCLRCHAPLRLRRGSKRERCTPCAEIRKDEMRRLWAENNLMRVRERWAWNQFRRKAQKNGAGSERFSREEIFIRDRWRCGICSKRIDRRVKWPHPMSPSLDHIIPLAEGGAHTRANTRAAHLGCNCRRGAGGGNEQLALVG